MRTTRETDETNFSRMLLPSLLRATHGQRPKECNKQLKRRGLGVVLKICDNKNENLKRFSVSDQMNCLYFQLLSTNDKQNINTDMGKTYAFFQMCPASYRQHPG